MTDIELAITTRERRLLIDLIGEDNLTADKPVEIMPGFSVTYTGSLRYKTLNEPEVIMLVLTIGVGIPVGVVANWISSKLQHRENTSLKIDRIEIEIEEGQITRAISEKIERKWP